MKLFFAGDVGKSADEEPFWWACVNNEECISGSWYEGHIPAPEYAWEYDAQGIPDEDLEDWPELARECAEKWQRYPRKKALPVAERRRWNAIASRYADVAKVMTCCI